MEVDEVLYFMARLTIGNISEKDAGEYRATAVNSLGSTNATINLNFDVSGGKPK